MRRRLGSLRRSPLRWSLGLVLALAGSLGASSQVHAQDSTGAGDRSAVTTSAALTPPPARNAREISLRMGFVPDPVVLEGVVRTERGASVLAPPCSGFVGEQPSQILNLSARMGFLRVFVLAEGRATLAIRGPSGHVRCVGEPLFGAPREEGSFGAGRYEIWVGTRSGPSELRYALHITEMRSVTPSTTEDRGAVTSNGAIIGLLVASQTSRFEDRRIRRGFIPDPIEDPGEAGGPIDLAALGGECHGATQAEPSHILTLQNEFDYFRVFLRSVGRVSLAIRTPSGRYLCSELNDESPSVAQDRWETGRYLIWVGGERGSTSEYRIFYTEARRRRVRR